MNLVRGGASSSPASLFAGGEPGAWYDPSDLTTLFQDSTGSTPVTATGQTVGLMLDKSQGLVLGSERLTNGDFSGGSTGWSVTGNDATHIATFSGGTLRYQSDTTTPILNVSQTGTMVVGKTYLVTVVTSAYTSGSIKSDAFGATVVLSNGLGTITFRGTASSTGFVITRNSTNVDITIDSVSIKEIAGNHATQATSTQRPTYQIDSNGKPYLLFDGVDDGMVTGTITPAIDKVQVFAGVRKLGSATEGTVVELSASRQLNSGCFTLIAPTVTLDYYNFASKGTSGAFATLASTSPITNILSGIGDISAPNAVLRVNGGAEISTVTTTQGTGNYLAYPLYIGRRGGASNPFNGRLYSLIVRFGPNLTTGQITSTESWVNGKTGAY
jgi:hypothetical protein